MLSKLGIRLYIFFHRQFLTTDARFCHETMRFARSFGSERCVSSPKSKRPTAAPCLGVSLLNSPPPSTPPPH